MSELLAHMGVAPVLQCGDCPIPGPFEPMSPWSRPVAYCPLTAAWRVTFDPCLLPHTPRKPIEEPEHDA